MNPTVEALGWGIRLAVLGEDIDLTPLAEDVWWTLFREPNIDGRYWRWAESTMFCAFMYMKKPDAEMLSLLSRCVEPA